MRLGNYREFLELKRDSGNLVSRVFEEWNREGRAEFGREYDQALKGTRIDVQRIFGERYKNPRQI